MLSNRTLLALFNSSLREQVRKTYNNNLFWKARTEHLAGRSLAIQGNVDWKRVYYDVHSSMLEIEEEDILLKQAQREVGAYFFGFDYLPSLLTLIQVHGKPLLESHPAASPSRVSALVVSRSSITWSTNEHFQKSLWKHITSPEVMHYLLNEGLLLVGEGDRYAQEGLLEAAFHNRDWMIDPILSVIQSDKRQAAVAIAVGYAVSGEHLSMVKLLMSKASIVVDHLILYHVAKKGTKKITEYFLPWMTTDLWQDMVNQAIEFDNADSLEVILKKAKLSREAMQALFQSARRSSGRVTVLLDKLDPSLKGKTTYAGLLSSTIGSKISGERELITYLLTKLKIADEGSKLLQLAVKRRDNTALQALVSDARVDPTAIINQLLNATQGQSDMVDTLILSPRLLVEDLNEDTLRWIVGSWIDSVRDRMNGLVQASGSDLSVLSLLSGDDLHSLLLRLLIVKRPTKQELMKWMLEKKDKRLITSAQLVLRDEISSDSELVPIQALMLCLLYPGNTYSEQVSSLVASGLTEDELRLSKQLLAAYFGEKMKQERK